MSDVRTEERPAGATRTGPNPPGDFIWYELMTTDPTGAKAFYDAVIGWNIQAEALPGPVEYRMIGRTDGGNAGGVLTLTADMIQHGARPIWLGYIHVSDVDETVAAIERAGGAALMPASDIPDVGRIAMMKDPQGAPFYVMKPIPPAGREKDASDVFSPTAEQRVGWNELITSDRETARRFYGDQFGWTSDEFMPMGELGEYRFWDHHGVRLGAVCGPIPDEQPHWRYYFRVPSIAKAKEIAEANGGIIHMGPHEVPGGDWIIIGKDPQGAEFALVGGE